MNLLVNEQHPCRMNTILDECIQSFHSVFKIKSFVVSKSNKKKKLMCSFHIYVIIKKGNDVHA